MHTNVVFEESCLLSSSCLVNILLYQYICHSWKNKEQEEKCEHFNTKASSFIFIVGVTVQRLNTFHYCDHKISKELNDNLAIQSVGNEFIAKNEDCLNYIGTFFQSIPLYLYMQLVYLSCACLFRPNIIIAIKVIIYLSNKISKILCPLTGFYTKKKLRNSLDRK